MKLYASIDFMDELSCAVWTPQMLDEYFGLMKSKGISRLYWIDQKEIMERSGAPAHHERVQQSLKNFKGDLHRAAAEIAHKNGLEIFAIIKPYEHCIPHSADSEAAQHVPGIPTLTGKQHFCTDFGVQHQDAMLRRQVFPGPSQKIVKYVISFDAPLKEEGTFKVFGSAVNKDYKPVSERKVAPGTAVIEVPADDFKYMVFVLEGASGQNTVRKIVTALDSQGNTVPFTLALSTNQFYNDIVFNKFSIWRSDAPEKNDFRKLGMTFDRLPGVPSSLYSPDLVEEERFFNFAEAEEHALGVTSELNMTVTGVPDPENELFRNFMTEWISDDLDRGFDGIEIRIANHNSPIFWREYGYGSKTRLARGNAHTALLRKLSELTRKRGRKFGLHVANFMFGSTPEKSSPMEFFWDYRTWLNEKICDEVTYKLIGSDGCTPEGAELLELCRKQQIPVNFCRFFHSLPEPEVYAAKIRAFGAEAFNVYETASLWAWENGSFVERNARQVAALPEILAL